MNPDIFKTISYGLYIVSTASNGKKNGYIANTVFQLTADPPKFGISCHKENLTAGMIKERKAFSVSVLSQHCKRELINKFGYRSGSKTDKFQNTGYFETEEGLPVVKEGCVAWLTFELEETIDLGSHYLFVGRLTDGDTLAQEPPLTYDYYHEVFKSIAPKNAPTYLSKKVRKEEASKTVKKKKDMRKYECMVCRWIYDPEVGDPDNGIPPGTSFEDLPDDWGCPDCGTEKSDFAPI